MDEIINRAKNKTQQARLIGIKTPEDGDWSNYSSKNCGSVGGALGDTFNKEAVSDNESKSDKKS
ncbi:small, acid-soluble spore protein, alpha/beta type [Clostridium estertheticum]|uniref:small, acid-soluble spore protein, alpha/beta type n=1 Tax=Clostridium estertheticum TaxID=238834 RepID=UPI001C6E5DFA|nr:small, acid-soluble spore protein, alpha/beta type [Clostridium estertheticum]MBW9153023.1 alpha/beta-type small acid-soluble spore protein [Clostridium estertheticum]WLC82615.1 alpha/beta-type small acid-soluble spore protein [Clostridium estertheticum]